MQTPTLLQILQSGTPQEVQTPESSNDPREQVSTHSPPPSSTFLEFSHAVHVVAEEQVLQSAIELEHSEHFPAETYYPGGQEDKHSEPSAETNFGLIQVVQAPTPLQITQYETPQEVQTPESSNYPIEQVSTHAPIPSYTFLEFPHAVHAVAEEHVLQSGIELEHVVQTLKLSHSETPQSSLHDPPPTASFLLFSHAVHVLAEEHALQSVIELEQYVHLPVFTY